MLLGQYSVAVGEKGRIAFPKRFRQVLGDRLVVTFGFENALMVVSESNWKTLLSGTEDAPFLLSGARETKRFLLGSAVLIELDGQGRFVLQEYLRNFAKIEKEVVVVGQDRYVEIWDSKNWHEYQKKAQETISQVAEKLVESIESTK